MRPDGRANDSIRTLDFERKFTENPHGSVLVRWGRTHVLCTASFEDGVPPFLKGSGKGWLTAEYSMLPGSTRGRKRRDISKLKMDGRSTEIQRLIGRSLRAGIDLKRLGERTLWIDCDVIQADGGTRTASISGAWVAVQDAIQHGLKTGLLTEDPTAEQIIGVSVGVVDAVALLDLEAVEDQAAEVDMNLVMTADGRFVEFQGAAEKGTFGPDQLSELLRLGQSGVQQVAARQREALGRE